MNNLSYRNLGAPEQPFEIEIFDPIMNNTRNNFAMNINAWAGAGTSAGPEQTPDNPLQGYTKMNKNLLKFGNAYRRNEKAVESFYTSAIGQRRLPPFVRAVNQFPFDLAGDECVTPREELIASSIVSSIQARLARMFFNAGPMMSYYGNWGSDGTLYMLSDYLLRKLEREYRNIKILGVIYDNFDIVEKAYSKPEDEINRGFQFYKNRTPRENFRVLILCILRRMLDIISSNTEYPSLNKSLFDAESGNLSKFTQLSTSYFLRMIEYYRDENPDNLIASKQEQYEYLYNLGRGPEGDEAQYLQASYYFFPIAHLTAAYIITWDVSELSSGIKDLDFQLSSQKAQADDSILTAVNGVLSTQFSDNFSGLPVTISDYEGTRRTYYRKEELEDRRDYLEGLLEGLRALDAPDVGLGEKEDWYFEAKANNYCFIRADEAPDQVAYQAYMTKLFDWALEHPNRGGLRKATSMDLECERALIGNNLCPRDNINDVLARTANHLVRDNIMRTFLDGSPPRSFCDVCDMDDATREETFGYNPRTTANSVWAEGSGDGHYWGRGQNGHTSQAASAGIMRSDINTLLQKLCGFMTAPNLFEAARVVGFGQEAEAERDRIAIETAQIQDEINTLSRYI